MADLLEVTVKLAPYQVELLNSLIVESATDGKNTLWTRIARQQHALDDDGERLLSTQPFCDDQETAKRVGWLLQELQGAVRLQRASRGR